MTDMLYNEDLLAWLRIERVIEECVAPREWFRRTAQEIENRSTVTPLVPKTGIVKPD